MGRFGPAVAVFVATALASCIIATAAERSIPNPLNLNWPGELVSMDLPTAEAAGVRSVRVGDADPRPAGTGCRC